MKSEAEISMVLDSVLIRIYQIVSAAKKVFLIIAGGGDMVNDRAYYDSLTELIISCAFKVGNQLGSGISRESL
jgi:polysaccharide pyruvyl transferase WcaK-like protein